MDLSKLQQTVDTFEASLEQINALPEHIRGEVKKIFSDAINAGKWLDLALRAVEQYVKHIDAFELRQWYFEQIGLIEAEMIQYCKQVREKLQQNNDIDEWAALSFEPVKSREDNPFWSPLSWDISSKYLYTTVWYQIHREEFASVAEKINQLLAEATMKIYEVETLLRNSETANGYQDSENTFVHYLQSVQNAILQHAYDGAYWINTLESPVHIQERHEKKIDGLLPYALVEDSSQYRRKILREDERWSSPFSDNVLIHSSFPDDLLSLQDSLKKIPLKHHSLWWSNHTLAMQALSDVIAQTLEM